MFYIGRGSAIIQLSAVCEDQIFNSYITPIQDISEEASRVTGIQFNAATNELLHDNKPVLHRHPLNVLLDFIQFLMLIGKKAILVSHNNKSFDCIILYNQLKYQKIWSSFCKYVIGFCDTLPFFKKLYPGLECYKQEYLAMKLLQKSYSAHNALDDCKMLQLLVQSTGKVDVLLANHLYGVSQVTAHGVQPAQESLEYLVKQKIISKAMLRKFEITSITYEHLKLAFQRDGFDGIFYLLSEKNEDGTIRVTRNCNVVKKISDYFCKL